jgi:hypothetical protein
LGLIRLTGSRFKAQMKIMFNAAPPALQGIAAAGHGAGAAAWVRYYYYFTARAETD